MKKRDLEKQLLYESVKKLVDTEQQHIQLTQHKLFTLVSIAFQYMLYLSTKNPGHYIVRAENSFLADKLAKKAKDPSTRKFFQQLLLPRKLKYHQSHFHLDFFNVSSWTTTKDIPKEKIRGAIIIKNTAQNPLIDETDFRHKATQDTTNALPDDYYISSLQDFIPRLIYLCTEELYQDLTPITFEHIKPEEDLQIKGLKIAKDVKIDI